MTSQAQSEVHVPRIAIKFCTQCKWNLRAAYYAQELLQTFSTTLGEVSLIPVTGGIFTVTIYHHISQSSSQPTSTSEPPTTTFPPEDQPSTPISALAIQETLLWDRKAEGGFPETKELKNRVRNIVEPGRDLGHIDRSLKKGKGEGEAPKKAEAEPTTNLVMEGDDGKGKGKQEDCKDCP